jgi:RHH-type proline utilization regulon transcriptional repressor/proline dehydrogenase/delta 1-pyrroline-5-carboxylate dehydrogenase
MSTATQPPHADLEARISQLGHDLWRRMGDQAPSLFQKSFWQGQLLDLAMRDPGFRVDLFRFVDCLPMLVTAQQVAGHVREYLVRDGRQPPGLFAAALQLASGGPAAWPAAHAIRHQVAQLARRFIAGQDARDALPALRRLWTDGLAFTADLLGEATVSPAEADACRDRYLTLIDALCDQTASWPADERLDRAQGRPLPRANVSVKVSALAPFLDPADVRGSVGRLLIRARPLLLRARTRGAFITFDLEQWALHQITYDLLESLLQDPTLHDWPDVGIVVQAYLRSAPADLERLGALARWRGVPITVRLVKGAYWEYEVVRSGQTGCPCPVLADKAATDAQYEALSARLLDWAPHLEPAFGSHNLRSVSHALAAAQVRGRGPGSFELQMLYGMAEPERRALRDLGHRVRIYAPIGDLLPGMAYLVRRLLENTSNRSFLRMTYHEHTNVDALLAAPRPAPAPPAPRIDPAAPFVNCPLTDFTDDGARQRFAQAVAATRARLPLTVPTASPGPRSSAETWHRPCPSEPALVVATITPATLEGTNTAVAAAYRAYPAWRDRPLSERAALLEALAEELQRHREDLAALETYETAKPWREADADVAEAIDYCRYYARQALLELAPHPAGATPGEDNLMIYQGRGPTAVIAPWNFPLAILCGMATAALVAGNPVLLKPAEQSSALGYALYRHMLAAGLPAEVVYFLPGLGEVVGARLVEHELVAQVAFTGSLAVGLGLLERAGRMVPGQRQVKRVVCEMGGKNATVIDDDADLDEAVAAVVASAFGYAGQKCSACSRVLTVGGVHQAFLARLCDAARGLILAPAHEPSCQVPPVIDEQAQGRLLAAIANPGPGAELVLRGASRDDGWYVPPAIFVVYDPQHRLMQEELFGPVLAVMPVPDFAQALAAAATTPYALTAAVFSRTPSHLEEARRALRVGNLYLNRSCTGAMVGRQPFGGLGLSGLGSKAGGPGYLRHFADPRVITENTMRRGMTPDLL